MDRKIKDIQQRIDQLRHFKETDFSSVGSAKTLLIKQQMQSIIQEINEIPQQDLSNNIRLSWFWLKGQILNIPDEYNPEAEELFTRITKMKPKFVESWEGLGEVLWKKRDYLGALRAFEGGLKHCETPNKRLLRKLSMTLRQVGVDLNEKKQNAFLALARAKQALELDLNDGESWYVLGNAHLTCFFLSDSNKSEDLNKALTAYNIAESKVAGEVKLDLLYNRATIYQYLEDYPRALEGYQQAATLDPSWAAPRQKIATIIDNTTRTQSLIQKKGNLKRKKIDELAARLKPLTATILSNYCSVLFRDLQLAFNSNVFVVGKVIAFVSNVTTIPFILVMIDASGEPIGVSIYNIRNDAIKYEDTLTIFDPYVLNVNITSKNHQAISYKVIQVHSIQKLHINGAPLKSTSYVHTDFNLLTSQQ